jgi:hypothetical protein
VLLEAVLIDRRDDLAKQMAKRLGCCLNLTVQASVRKQDLIWVRLL